MRETFWQKVFQVIARIPSLLTALILLCLAAIILLYTARTTDHLYSPSRDLIIYPLLILSSILPLPLLIANLIWLGVLTRRIFLIFERRNDYPSANRIAFLAPLLPVLLIALTLGLAQQLQPPTANSLYTFVVLGSMPVAVMMTILLSRRYVPAAKALTAIGFIVFATTYSCFSCAGLVFSNYTHITSVYAEGYRYNLVTHYENDWECADTDYLLFQCDSVGLMCQQVDFGRVESNCFSENPRPVQRIGLRVGENGAIIVAIDDQQHEFAPR